MFRAFFRTSSGAHDCSGSLWFYLVKLDDCYCLVQFSLDVFVWGYLTSQSGIYKFKICKFVRHRTIQINHQLDATIFQFIILRFVYSSTCFGWFPAHHQELMTAVAARGCYCSHELLIMGGKTPETCWAVNKLQDNKLENVCIYLVIYLNSTMMHGITNLNLWNPNLWKWNLLNFHLTNKVECCIIPVKYTTVQLHVLWALNWQLTRKH
jgi:hypothetical protein